MENFVISHFGVFEVGDYLEKKDEKLFLVDNAKRRANRNEEIYSRRQVNGFESWLKILFQKLF